MRPQGNPLHPALHFEGQTWTYEALNAWIEEEVAFLQSEGVTHGDRVAILAHNHPRTLALLFACAQLGAILTPLNYRLAPPELDWILQDSTPTLLLTDDHAPPTRAHLKPSPLGRGLGEGAPQQPPQGQSSTARKEKPSPACGRGLGEGANRETNANNGEQQPLLLIYTSGTTGRPKGALLTQAALKANAHLSQHMHALTPKDHILTVLPLFHVGGLNIQTLPALLHGATVTLHPRFDPAATLNAIANHKPTLTVLVPATLQALSAHPHFPTTDLSSLRAITTGSTIVQPAATAPFTARRIPVLQVYGSTETAPIAIYTPLGTAYPPQSTGHPGPQTQAIATTDDGTELPDNTPGEIRLKGPQLFTHYWQNPLATEEALENGWYKTGDIGTRHPNGSWTVHDRKKNLIVSGGENIYPAEIERVLHDHPEIAEAAVTSAPHPRWQEVPHAHVVLRPGATLTEPDIIAHIQANLARYKTPHRVHFHQTLPRNAMGKVQHMLLKTP